VKLSTKGRYAVMAMVDLARQGANRPVTLAEIAERQDISLSYLEQLFGKLRKGAQVKSVRGPGGGYMLPRHPSEMRIVDIIVAVDEPIKATRCTPGVRMIWYTPISVSRTSRIARRLDDEHNFLPVFVVSKEGNGSASSRSNLMVGLRDAKVRRLYGRLARRYRTAQWTLPPRAP